MKSREWFHVYAIVDRTDGFGVFRNPRIGSARIDPTGEISVTLDALPVSGKLFLVLREENEFEKSTREMMEGKDK